MNQDLVSVIMPSFNTVKYIEKSIESVLNQTYKNLELIIVDDCSTDNTDEIIKPLLSDKRIKYIKNEKNSGAAVSRNKAMAAAQGKWIAFLDSDDIWEKDKLEKQIDFMEKSGCAFSFTGYEFADANGKPLGTIVNVPKKINYKQALKNTTIFTSTVMFDMNKISKEDIYMPNVRRGQDTAYAECQKRSGYCDVVERFKKDRFCIWFG